jgi:predicted nucleic acid-binding protein
LTSGLVVDASVSGGWFIGDEASPLTDAALSAVVRSGATVPVLWSYEMANLLVLAERRGRISRQDVVRVHEALAALPISFDEPSAARGLPSLTRLARDHGLTAYDAAYLELAQRRGSELATRDSALREAARRAGVPVFEA